MTTIRRHAMRLAAALLACVLAGCASTTAPAAGDVMSPDDEARATAVVVVSALRDAGLPVERVAVCTSPAPAPKSHPRPLAAAFDDPRVGTADPRHVIREGGVVEVLGSASEVEARVAELDQQALDAQSYGFDEGGHTLQPERRLTEGAVLLRLSGNLAPDVLNDYAAALHDAVPAVPDLSLLNDTEEAPCST